MNDFHSKVMSALYNYGYFAAPKDEFFIGYDLSRERVTKELLEMLRTKIAGDSVGGMYPFDCTVHYRSMQDNEGRIIVLVKGSAFQAKPRTVMDCGM